MGASDSRATDSDEPRATDRQSRRGFRRSGYPPALSRELAKGAVTGQDFRGARIVRYRDDAARTAVQSA
jgi:tagatose-1,6-bisphosphate aldolase non-catalytic subunit AgaZ/GatZ